MTINNTPDKYIAQARKEMSDSLLRLFLNEAGTHASSQFIANYDALASLVAVTNGYNMEDTNDALEALVDALGAEHVISLLITSILRYDY